MMMQLRFLVAVAILSQSVTGTIKDPEEDCPDLCCIDSVCCGDGTQWDGIHCIPGAPLPIVTPTDVCIASDCQELDCCGPGTMLKEDPSRGTTKSGDPSCMCVIPQCQYRRPLITEFTEAEQQELADLVEEYNSAFVIQLHYQSGANHGTPRFLPWHQGYIEGLEYFLGLKNKPEFIPLPKWDPATKTIPPAFNKIDPSCSDVLPTPNCGSLPTPPFDFETLPASLVDDNVCAFSTVSTMQRSLERWHNGIHGEVGAAFTSFQQAPQLLLFLLWHAYVDDIYYCYCQCGDCSQVTPEPFIPPPQPLVEEGPDGELIVTVVSEFVAVVPPSPIETNVLDCLIEVRRQAEEEIPFYEVSGDGVTASVNQTIDLWNQGGSGAEIIATLDEAEGKVAALAESPSALPGLGFYLGTFQQVTGICKVLILA